MHGNNKSGSSSAVRIVVKALAKSLLCLGVASTPTLRAQTEQGYGIWTMVVGQGSLKGVSPSLSDVRWWLDTQPRYTDKAAQFLVRPGLGYTFADNAAVWAGYTWVWTDAFDALTVIEQNIWEQLTWSPNLGPVKLGIRPRLEQRFVDAGSDVGWRFRQLVKAAYPLPAEPRLRLTTYDEVFINLNNTDWGARTGFSQNRLFVGLGWQLSPEATVEMGYLNQFLNGRGTDGIFHLFSVNLILNF